MTLSGREGAAPASDASAGDVESREASALALTARRIRAESDLPPPTPDPSRPAGSLSSLLNALGRIKASGEHGEGRGASGHDDRAGRELRTATAARGEATATSPPAISGVRWNPAGGS